MSAVLDTHKLAEYVSTQDNTVLIEDLNHFLDLNIITEAISATENGSYQRLPLRALFNLTKAFLIYRDEFQKRCSDADKSHETALLILKAYYDCVQSVRTLNKYLNRYLPITQIDYDEKYLKYSESKEAINFSTQVIDS
jgi:hypothetical protein